MIQLPLSGWVLQWGSDDCWRELNAEQLHAEMAGAHQPSPEDWVHWTGTMYRQGRGGGLGAEWSLAYDELPVDAAVTVKTASGTYPVVHVVGKVWACEWPGGAPGTTVTVTGPHTSETWEVPVPRADYVSDS